MSNVLEQFEAAVTAVETAQKALGELHNLLGAHNGTPPTAEAVELTATPTKRNGAWNFDKDKKARAVRKFRRTMRAKARQRQLALAEPTEPSAA